MQVLGQRGNDQGDAQHPQQQLLGIRMRHQPADVVTPAVGRRERHTQRGDCRGHADHRHQPTAARAEKGHQWQIDRHCEVLKHQHCQHRRSFPVTEPVQVFHQARDHTRRRDVGNPG
jgi:hypothetical protein